MSEALTTTSVTTAAAVAAIVVAEATATVTVMTAVATVGGKDNNQLATGVSKASGGHDHNGK
jgi:hypothetical protein